MYFPFFLFALSECCKLDLCRDKRNRSSVTKMWEKFFTDVQFLNVWHYYFHHPERQLTNFKKRGKWLDSDCAGKPIHYIWCGRKPMHSRISVGHSELVLECPLYRVPSVQSAFCTERPLYRAPSTGIFKHKLFFFPLLFVCENLRMSGMSQGRQKRGRGGVGGGGPTTTKHKLSRLSLPGR